MKQLFLPQYTIGSDAFSFLEELLNNYGHKVVIIHGEKAYKASKDKLLSYLNSFEITAELLYGKEATFDNIERLGKDDNVRKADVILAVGGGKCLDVCKVVGDRLDKAVVSIPTIASTCAAVTKISIIHNEDGSFKQIVKLKQPPVHCIIDSQIISQAPAKYFWAGIGDAMAKHVECCFSAKNDELDFMSEYGRTISSLCYYPFLKHALKAYEDVKKGKCSNEVEETIQSIIIATGSVSVSVNPDYNSAVAHALYYGMTVREWMERKHLHGEIVSYGTLVQLIVDKNYEGLEEVYKFNKELGLPVCLEDLDLDKDDPLDDILDNTVINQELEHVPFKVTKKMLKEAIDYLEEKRSS